TRACFAPSKRTSRLLPVKTATIARMAVPTQIESTGKPRKPGQDKAITSQRVTASVNFSDRPHSRPGGLWRRFFGLALVLGLILLPTTGFAQDISIDFGDETTLTERAIQLIALVTVLALAPSILVMVTSFTR